VRVTRSSARLARTGLDSGASPLWSLLGGLRRSRPGAAGGTFQPALSRQLCSSESLRPNGRYGAKQPEPHRLAPGRLLGPSEYAALCHFGMDKRPAFRFLYDLPKLGSARFSPAGTRENSPPIHRWETNVRQQQVPSGTPENSPPIYRWETNVRQQQVPQGRQKIAHRFIGGNKRPTRTSPAGTTENSPPIHRWETNVRQQQVPSGTTENSPPIHRWETNVRPEQVPQGRQKIAHRFIGGKQTSDNNKSRRDARK
jgi:hypothetical protein